MSPLTPDILGDLARRVMPYIRYFFVKKDGLTGELLERKLYILRKVLSGTATKKGLSIEEYYVPFIIQSDNGVQGYVCGPPIFKFLFRP